MKAYFAAGCFWGVEATFAAVKGVTQTRVGYAGGSVDSPTYEQVCTDRTGHAEVVEVEYDPEQVSYEDLLETFWKVHDPTQVNRQGPDVGTQYRTAIFYVDDSQKDLAETAIATLDASERFTDPIATLVEPMPTFYPAEEYHQQYLAKRGMDQCHLPN